MSDKLKDALTDQKQQTEQYNQKISGILGITINGARTVEVANRNSYVYVRLRNTQNELIQAFNNRVAPSYNLPVMVERQGNRYVVLDVDTKRYDNNWGSYSPYLPRHGNTHSFNMEGGGGDIVWVYPRQFMPLLALPSGSVGSPNVIVSAYTLKNDNGTWKYVGNTGTASFTPYNPTTSGSAVMGLIYLDTTSGNPYFLIGSGTPFASNLTGTSQVYPYIPAVTSPNTQIPIAAVRLISGTSRLTWDNIYDVRQFVHTQPTGSAGGGLSSLSVQDEGVAQGSITTLNFVGSPVDLSVSGSVARIFITGSSSSSTSTGTQDFDALFTHYADAGNTGTVETDLYSDTIAAGQLATNGDILLTEHGGVFVSSATATRQIKMKFAGTTIFDTGTLTLSISAAWTIYASITRVSASVIRYSVSLTTEGAALSAYTAVGELTGLTLSGTNIIKITGQAAGVGAVSNDIVAKVGSIAYVTLVGSGGSGGSGSPAFTGTGNSVVLTSPSGTLYTAPWLKWGVSSNEYVEFGADEVKETNAGKMGYNAFGDGYFDIVGAGTGTPARTVKIYDNLNVDSDLVVGGNTTLQGTTAAALSATSMNLPSGTTYNVGGVAHTHSSIFSDAEGDPAALSVAADGVSTFAARRDHVHATLNGSAVLGGSVSITGSAGVYIDTGLSVTLPSSGTYAMSADVRGHVKGSTGTAWWLHTELFNSTDAAAVANSERLIVLTAQTGVLFQTTCPISIIITVNASKVIKLYAARNGNTSPTWLTSNIESDANGRTSMSYEKIA